MNKCQSVEFLKDNIRSLMHEQYPSSTLLARRIGTSRSSLLRWLDQRGKTYSDLVDEVRLAEAKTLISREDLKLYEIAGELGFTEASSFTRAFLRWTGISPRHYRAQQRFINGA